jgi:two-component system, OmpR family, sensor histidine kinase KdpD
MRRRGTRIGRRFRASGAVADVAGSLLGVGVATALIAWLRGQADIPNVSMLYLLVVLALASTLGRVSAILAAVLAFLAFNFFFVEPLYTFHVANPQELLALGVLLITAMVTGQLAAALRARAHEAEAREREVSTLYELSQILGREGSLEERMLATSRRLVDLLGVSGCDVILAEKSGELDVEAPCAGRGADTLCLPLESGDRRLGVLRLVGFSRERFARREERDRLRALAGLLAQAAERDRLAAQATDAEVLRRADQTKTALLSSVSHDLRTPLASIKASATNLLDEEVDWDRAARRELLQAIDEETDRLSRFVSRLLDLSRVEGGGAQPRKDWHQVGEILNDVAQHLDPEGERISLDIPGDLPLANVDYVMIEQVVANLVENALKYSPRAARIDLRAEVHDGHLWIDVADRGPGVPPGERERIFEKFYRSAGRASAAPGTGIGLAIARGLAQAHDGDVGYAARPGGGSVFRVSLPLGPNQPEPPAP